MRLLIVRHGQTSANLESVVQSEDSRLSNIGRKQAEALARHLKDERIDVAYFSDLPRAAETADIILSYHQNTKRTPSEVLREKKAGAFIGQRYEVYRKAREVSGHSFAEFRPEGGESLVDVQARIAQFYRTLLQNHPNETVLLVSHAGAITCLLLHLLQKSFDQFPEYRAENTSLTIIEVDSAGIPTFHLINSVAHVPRKLVPALFFHALTPLYDIITQLVGYGAILQKKVLSVAPIKNESRVIDIGCGTGTFLIELKKAFPSVDATGTDPDSRALAIARRKLDKARVQARLEEQFAEWLFFRPHSFDVAVSVLMFNQLSVPAQKRMLKDTYRILSPGGFLLLADFGGRKHIPLLEEAGFVVHEAAPRWRMVDFLLAQRR